MDRLTRLLGLSRAALASLQEVLRMEKSVLVRDASIQRFEYTFEPLWKTAQLFLRRTEGLDLPSPGSVFRAVGAVGLLNAPDVKLTLQMLKDRNLTVHIYYEQVAEQVYSRLPRYAPVLERLLAAMDNPQQLSLVSKE